MLKKLKAVLLVLILPFIFFTFAGCGAGTKLSKLTGINSKDIVSISYSYAVQSMVLSIKENYFGVFFQAINVEYEEKEDSSNYAENYLECMCYHVILNDNKTLNLDYYPNKTIYATYYDGENYYHYVSCGKVYIPWYAVQPK